jgi:CBS domain containing-hemolysin-like protein
LSRAKIQALLDSRGKKRDPLKIWLDNPSALLTSILIGNNLVNVTASALATDIASKIFQSQAIAAAVGVMTLVILVFGEITPKVMARRYAEQFVSSVAYTLGLFYYVTWPITRFFTWTTSSLIKITGGDPSQDFSTVEVEELELLVSLSAREGGIDKHPASIINRVFNLSRLTVKDIMIPRTEMIALEQSEDVNHIIRIANSSGHSRLPVYRENLDQMVGVFHVKDLLLVSHEEWRDFKVADHFHPPYYVPESAPLGRTLREFQKRKIHLAVVVDEFGGTEGVVTLEDILEELVGEIQDEFDRDVVMMRKLPSGALEVSGRAPVEDLRKIFPQLESEFPSKTVGGLIMEITGRVPSPGETADALGLRFTIVGADERQIKRVRVEPLTPS